MDCGWPRIEGSDTQVADPAVVRAWREDPEPFHAVVLLLTDPVIERRRAEVARALHPWCGLTSPEQAHITLTACGREPPPLAPSLHQIDVGGADSFSSAAFLHVSGLLAELRAQVLRLVGNEVDPQPRYVPHITVGTYRWPMPAQEVARRLTPLRDPPPLRTVGRLAVVVVDKRRGRLLPSRTALECRCGAHAAPAHADAGRTDGYACGRGVPGVVGDSGAGCH